MTDEETDNSGATEGQASMTALRTGLPVLIVLIGLAMLVYGVAFHSTSVLVEQNVKAPPPAPPLPPGLPFDPDEPVAGPPDVPTTEIVALSASERQVIHDTTVGGLTRLPSGRLKRTYTGAVPSLCPT